MALDEVGPIIPTATSHNSLLVPCINASRGAMADTMASFV